MCLCYSLLKELSYSIFFSSESYTKESVNIIMEKTTPSFFQNDHHVTSPISQQGTDHSPPDDIHDQLCSASKNIDEASSDFENDSTDIMSPTSPYSGLPDLSKIHVCHVR